MLARIRGDSLPVQPSWRWFSERCEFGRQLLPRSVIAVRLSGCFLPWVAIIGARFASISCRPISFLS